MLAYNGSLSDAPENAAALDKELATQKDVAPVLGRDENRGTA